MSNKLKTMKLSHGHAPDNPLAHATPSAWRAALRYRVEQVTDSVEFAPGQMLDRRTVEDLCASTAWKVTIVPIK